MHEIVDPRQLRGLQIAAKAKIVRKGVVWSVPSQSGAGRYEVSVDAEEPHCSCPDHETRGVKCKHIFAVEYVIQRERNADGHNICVLIQESHELGIDVRFKEPGA